MNVNSGNNPACAACKYQRRRCAPDCILAPFFPADETPTFLNVHRLYGVANIMKILNNLNSQDEKEEAMKSIKYEANMRAKYPVHGCLGIVRYLKYEIYVLFHYLQYIYEQLKFYRQQKPNYPFPLSSNSNPNPNPNPNPNQRTPQFFDDENHRHSHGHTHLCHLEDNKSLLGIDQPFLNLNIYQNGMYMDNATTITDDNQQSYMETSETRYTLFFFFFF